jgi:hypothetical protein
MGADEDATTKEPTMTRMIRLMTVLIVAAATPATFAGPTEDAANRSADDKQEVLQTKGTTGPAEAGGGRGEMPGSPSQEQLERGRAELERARAEQRAKDEAGIQEYNHNTFLNDTWTK